MASILGLILFVFTIFAVAWMINLVIVFYGSKRGWFEEQPHRTRWYDKIFDRMYEIYTEDLENKKDGI